MSDPDLVIDSAPWLPILRGHDGALITGVAEWQQYRDRLLRDFDTAIFGSTVAISPDDIGKTLQVSIRRGLSSPAPCIVVLAAGDGPLIERDGVWGTRQIQARGWNQAVIAPAAVVADSASGAACVRSDDGGSAPGVLSAWASVISGCIDRLIDDPLVDNQRIAVVGQSRLGKAALLAAARDDRISALIASQSGIGGAAPMRDVVVHRQDPRETPSVAAKRFPYWFTPGFADYADVPERLPVDAHQLIALCAPRFVMLPNARQDAWVDPPGQRIAMQAALPVWELLSERPILPQFSTRAGRHGIEAAEWGGWLDQLDTNWQS